jgi:lipopolysaccharide/colanic/teichoic acid biosynthesis glycosyltransferase
MCKRGVDVVVGTAAALLVLPAIVLLAVGVALSLRTNPFFVQRRVGRGGRLIPIVKLRTLPRTAPRNASKYELGDIAVPPFARLLRRLHLDELPQLFLVPFGYLSLVGPRPEMPVLHAGADPRFAAERVQVRPGCTGLWQVSEAADGLIWEAPQYDRHYLRNQSIALDLWIMWRTVLTLTGLAAPVRLHEVPAPRLRPSASVELSI